MKNNKTFIYFALPLFLLLCVSMSVSCGKKERDLKTDGQESSVKCDSKYLVLVNKQNPLPDGWEDSIKIAKTKNSIGDDVETEETAYNAYLRLKEALSADGIKVDLDFRIPQRGRAKENRGFIYGKIRRRICEAVCRCSGVLRASYRPCPRLVP